MNRTQTYLLLDAARCGMETIVQAQDLCHGQHATLYLLNDSNWHLASIAPYLFRLDDGLKNWFLENGYGLAWGMMISTPADFEVIRGHFRKFLKVRTEEGKQLHFRFYDPRVLKIFLPTCDKDQVLEFFGPIENFLVEYDDAQAIEFSQEKGILQQQKKTIYKTVIG